MSAEVEKVVLELSTDVKAIRQGLDDINRGLADSRAAAKSTQDQLRKLRGETGESGTALGGLRGELLRLAAAFSISSLIDRAVSGLANLGKSAIASAGQIVDLSQQTGLSIQAVQVYGEVAKESGGDLNTYADAIFKLGINLERPSTEIKAILRDWGISIASIQAMKPEQQFELVAKKLHGVSTEQEMNRKGFDLMGKTFAAVKPGIVSGIDEIRNSMEIASDQSVKAIDRWGDAWDRMWDRAEKKAIGFLGRASGGLEIMSGDLQSIFDDMEGQGVPDIVRNLFQNLGFEAGGIEGPPGAKGKKETPEQKEARLKAIADAEAYAKALRTLADTLTGRGVAQEIKKYADAVVLANKAGGISVEQMPKLIETLHSLELQGGKLPPVLKEIADQFYQFAPEEVTRRAKQFISTLNDGLPALETNRDVLRSIREHLEGIADTGGRLPPDIFTGLVNTTPGVFPGASAKGVTLGPKPADLTNLNRFTDLMVTANRVMGQFGHTNTIAWNAVQGGIQIAIGWLQQYTAAMKIQDAAAKAAAISASLASAAMAAATLGISLVIGKIVNLYQQYKQYKADRDSLWGQLAEFGVQAPSRDQMGLNRKDYLAYLQQRLDDIKKRSEAATTAVGRLTDLTSRLGGVAPNAFKSQINDLMKLTGLSDDARRSLAALQGKSSWQFLDEGADKFGVAKEALGSAVNTQRLGASFDEINNFLTMATEQGGNRSQLIAGVADEVSKLLLESKKTGAALPSFFRPWVEEMAKANLLLDDLGQPIDTSAFTWTDAVKSTMEQVADILKEIRDLLAQALPQAAVRAGDGMVDLADDVDTVRHRLRGADDAAMQFLDGVKRDVAQSLAQPGVYTAAEATVAGSAARTTAGLPEGWTPQVVKQYSGTVEVNYAGHRLGDVVLEDLLRAMENNAGNGQPVGPTTRLAGALARVR